MEILPISYLGGLTRKIDGLSNLSFEEQSVLLVDLKRCLRDPGATDDALTLIKKLRSRRDLFATIAEEIDDLIGKPSQKAMVPSQPPVVKSSPKGNKSIHSDAASPGAKTTVNERWLGAFIGAIIGITFGILILILLIGMGSVEGVIIGAILGALIGSYIKRDKE